MIYRAPGKRSPDGRFREYKYNREIARAVVEHLQLRGIDAELLVPEDNDTPLKERVRRANKITCQIGHSLSDELATCLYKAAGKHLPGHKIRPISIRCESRKEALDSTLKCNALKHDRITILS